MSTDCARGDLPPKEYDIHCPLMGGPTHKNNYFRLSCLERRNNGGCVVKDCSQRTENKKEGTVAKKPLRKCRECGETKPIIGRGLCGPCYHRLKRHGKLEEKYPALDGRAAAAAAMAKEKKPSEAVSKDWPGPVSGEKPAEKKPAESAKEKSALFESEADRKEFKREPIESPAPPVKVDDDQIVLIFNERDQELLAGLREWAEEERRTLEAQILMILDKANANELAEAS